MRCLAVVLCLGLAACDAAPKASDPAPPPAGALGANWGSPPTAAMKKVGDTSSDGLDIFTPSVTPATFEGVAVDSADYQFQFRRLYGVDISIKGEPNRAAITAALTRRYGPPAFSNLEMGTYRWDWPNSPVEVSEAYQPDQLTTTIAVFLKEK